jgi:hypothetical protein
MVVSSASSRPALVRFTQSNSNPNRLSALCTFSLGFEDPILVGTNRRSGLRAYAAPCYDLKLSGASDECIIFWAAVPICEGKCLKENTFQQMKAISELKN